MSDCQYIAPVFGVRQHYYKNVYGAQRGNLPQGVFCRSDMGGIREWQVTSGVVSQRTLA